MNTIPPHLFWLGGLIWLMLINLLTFMQFARDKRMAERGLRRISEAHLLRCAFFGGTPGAFLARHRFRHKTRKQPFSTYLWAIAGMQLGVCIGLIYLAF